MLAMEIMVVTPENSSVSNQLIVRDEETAKTIAGREFRRFMNECPVFSFMWVLIKIEEEE